MKQLSQGKGQLNLPGKAKKPQNPNFGMKTPAMKKGGCVKKGYKKGGGVKGGGVN